MKPVCEFCGETLTKKYHSCKAARWFMELLKQRATEVSYLQDRCPDSECHVSWVNHGTSRRMGQVQCLYCTCGQAFVSILPREGERRL